MSFSTMKIKTTVNENKGLSISASVSQARALLAVPALVVLDLLGIFLSLAVAYLTRKYIFPALIPGIIKPNLLANTLENLWWFPLVLIAFFAYEGLYQKRYIFWKEVEGILRASTMAMIFSISLLYLAKLSGEMSRSFVLITWLCIIAFIPLSRYFGKLILLYLNIWQRPVLILGAGKTGELLANAFARERTMGYKIVGYLDDNHKLKDVVCTESGSRVKVLGTFAEAEKIIYDTGVQEVIVAAPGLPSKHLVDLANRLQPLVKNIKLVPDLFGLSLSGIEVEYFFNEQTLLLNVRNNLKFFLNRAIKRIFDVVIGLISLALCTPLLLISALAIKMDSKGSVFFPQERIGLQGKIFICYKFRTMYPEGDKLLRKHLKNNGQAKMEWKIYRKLKDYDPRLTRVGAFLRRFSLDELPQLINVLLGDMSLVGPRPYMPAEKKLMGSWLHDIQVSRPGITGLWQVSGRNNIDFEGRLKLDAWYVRNWSLWLDVIFLLKTIRVVMNRDGAY